MVDRLSDRIHLARTPKIGMRRNMGFYASNVLSRVGVGTKAVEVESVGLKKVGRPGLETTLSLSFTRV